MTILSKSISYALGASILMLSILLIILKIALKIRMGVVQQVTRLFNYFTDKKTGIATPIKQLVGFARIPLKFKESKTVNFAFSIQQLSCWNEETKSFALVPGDFEVMVGSSSNDIWKRDFLKFWDSNIFLNSILKQCLKTGL